MRELFLYGSLPILAILILRNPLMGLIAYVAVNIIRPEMLFWGGSQGAIVFKTFIGATIVSFLINNRSNPFSRAFSRELGLVFWIWLAILASLLFSTITLHPLAYDYAAEFLKMGILGWLILGILDSGKKILTFQNSLLVCYALLALWGIDQHFRGNERLEGLGGNSFKDSNGAAAIFVLALPLGINQALNAGKKFTRVLGWMSALMITIAIISTQSRGGFMGLCGCIILYTLYSEHKKKIILVLLLLLISVGFFASDQYLSRLSTITSDNEDRDLSAGSRLVLWKAGIMVFRDNPIFGAGFLSFPVAKLPYKDAVTNVDEALREYSFQGFKVGHNTFVQILAEGGLFLAIPYAWMLWGTFWANRKIKAQAKQVSIRCLVQQLDAVEAGLFGMCICYFFVDALTSLFIPMNILVARAIRNAILDNGREKTGTNSDNSITKNFIT